jgi:hypothetical protein
LPHSLRSLAMTALDLKLPRTNRSRDDVVYHREWAATKQMW